MLWVSAPFPSSNGLVLPSVVPTKCFQSYSRFWHINEANGSTSIVSTHSLRLYAAVKKRSYACWLNCNNCYCASLQFSLDVPENSEFKFLRRVCPFHDRILRTRVLRNGLWYLHAVQKTSESNHCRFKTKPALSRKFFPNGVKPQIP